MQKLQNFFNNHSEVTVILLATMSRLFLIVLGFVVLNGFSYTNLISSWSHWDSTWYLKIMNTGYDNSYSHLPPTDALCNMGTGFCQRNFAFFPLYPLVAKALSLITFTPVELAAIIVSNLSFVLASWMLFKLVRDLYGKRIALFSVLVLITFPISYIFSGIMTESLFLLLLIAAYYFAHKKKYLLAGMTGLLLSATRNTGFLFILPLILIYLEQRGSLDFKKINKRWLIALVLIPIGLISFMIFLHFQVGDALAFINVQKYWDKPIGGLNPLIAIPFALADYRFEGTFKIHLYNLAYFIVALGLGLWAVFRKVIPYSLSNILFWMTVPLTAGTMLALPRYLSVAFPIYILIAKLISKNKFIATGYFIISFAILVLMSILYIRGAWITV